MTDLVTNSGFWCGIALLNTLFLFRAFIRNILLSKQLESAIVKLTEKNKEIMTVESILGDKITSLMEELDKLKNS